MPWGSEVSTFFSISSSATSAPVGAGFVQCTLHLTPFERFRASVSSPVVASLVLLAVCLYVAWQHGGVVCAPVASFITAATCGCLLRCRAAHRRFPRHLKDVFRLWRAGVFVLCYLLYVQVCVFGTSALLL